MGQYYYTAIILGAVWEEPEDIEDITEVFDDWMLSKHPDRLINGKRIDLKTSYQCDDRWVGFMLADSDGNINTWYDPNAEDGDYHKQLGLCFSRQAIAISDLERLLEQIPFKLSDAKALWAEFVQEMASRGVDMPDGQLLLVDNFD